MGIKGLTNIQIDKFAKKNIKNYYGCFAQTVKFTKKLPFTCSFIINTNDHWIPCFKKGNHIFIHDSFNRPSNKLTPIFIKEIKTLKLHYTDAKKDYTVQQHRKECNCGQRSICWLMCIDSIGLKKSLLL